MKLFTPTTDKIDSFEERGKFLMAWRLSLIFTIVFSILSCIIFSVSPTSARTYGTMVFIAAIILFYLYRTQKSKLTFWIYAVSASVISHFTINSNLDTAHYSDFLWMLTTIIFTFVALGRAVGIFFTILHMIGIAFYIQFSLNAHFELVHLHTVQEKLALFTEISMGLILICYLLNQYLAFQSYAQDRLKEVNMSLEAQNETIIQQNKENVTLIKEVHHRVKNNLQIIISLLRMQRSEISSEEAQLAFSEAINRILTMSMIHQKLYQEKEPSKINIHEYLSDLTSELLSFSEAQNHVQLTLHASEEYTDLKTIVPFGLLVNELVSNSMKHAFSGTDSHEIMMLLSSDSEHLFFEYKDNGTWHDPDPDASGFGLELIEILTEQMEGTFERNQSTYHFKIRTPYESTLGSLVE